MDVNYTEMPANSRVWVYQSNRLLTDTEVEQVKIQGRAFVKEWTAHNQQLKAAFDIRYNLFLIILVDESHNDASGCSIDKSVNFILQTESQLGVQLTNRMLFAYKQGDTIEVCSKDQFEQLFKQGTITEDTTVFNNLVQTKAELESLWQLPLKDSWHKQLV